MSDLRELLESYDISPEWFLEKVRGPEGCRWREERSALYGDRRPDEYVLAAFMWLSVPCPAGRAGWLTINAEWEAFRVHERWLELEAAMGWLDPLEAELLEVGYENVSEKRSKGEYESQHQRKREEPRP